MYAATFGSLNAMKELLSQVQHSPQELGRGLYIAMTHRGGSAELVRWLIECQADVNSRWTDSAHFTRLAVALQGKTYHLGRRTAFSALCYHMQAGTPLMAAVQWGQHEGAAALIASGARLDMRNYQNLGRS